jgi:ATP-dependent Clp protease protease subunit
MIADFKYCSNPDADVPKMFIDKQIGGVDEKGEPGIDGNLFMKELLCLSDEMGKKNIQVWINSEGGYVQEGQSIYAGILHSKARVDTVCYGLAASISGVIFQAGRKRTMLDFANLMYHPAYNEDGTEDKGLTAMNDSIALMVASRTGKSLIEVKALMNAGKAKEEKGTWINASDADKWGFCDEVLKSDETNLKRMSSMVTPTAKWQFAQNALNKIVNKETIIKTKSMKNVCNKLGLNEEANETSIVNAITDMQVQNKKTVEDLNKKMEDLKSEMDTLKKEKSELEDKAKASEKAKAEADEEAKAKKETETKASAKVEVENLVKTGRIKNEVTIISKWTNMFEKDLVGTKELADSMPITRKGAVLNSTNASNSSSTLSMETKAELEMNGITFGSMEYENAMLRKKIK